MMWKNGIVVGPASLDCSGQPAIVTNDAQFRRYEFMQRKYKRKMDSFNDSLIFAIENAPAGLSNQPIVVNAGFRILLLE